MEKIFTIGFTKKTAEEFFTLLEKNFVSVLVDIRLNNTSQIAGFSKSPDLAFFLKKICNIGYVHDQNFVPNKKILNDFKQNKITWFDYNVEFLTLLEERNISAHIENFYFGLDRICFLCSEPTAEHCHRKIVAERFLKPFPNAEIIHLE